jgi:hypothetical protein
MLINTYVFITSGYPNNGINVQGILKYVYL